MPYIEGETLRDRLDREKQLPIEEALGIAIAVANALHTAHEAGVVHRDIKPANILLSRGEPLVADFGIALAVGAAGGSRLTETGLSVGTPYYMSPEQATADRDPTAASDVYALGCVLYEMLTGEPPFSGSTAQAVLARILTGEAEAPSRRRKSIPANVEAAITRSIERLPADRFKTAGDFARALGNPAFSHGPKSEGVAQTGSGPGPWMVATVVLTVLVAVLGMWGIGRGTGEASTASRQTVMLFDWDDLESNEAVSGSVRYGVGIARDGSALALRDLESDRLLIKERERLEAVPIAGTAGGFGPVFSPDGESIAFFSREDNSLRVVPRRGGSPVTLSDSIAAREQQIAWLDDGRIVFTGVGWHMDAVPEGGGPVERLLDVTGTGRFVSGVSALPDSRGVLVTSCDQSCPNPEVRVLDLGSGEARTLIAGATGAWYLDTGQLMFSRVDGRVFLAPFDLDGLEVAGVEAPILERIATTPRRADLAATWDGTVVYLPGSGSGLRGDVEPVWVTLEGDATPVEEGWAGVFADPALSPDGRYLAFADGTGADAEIRVRELPNGPITTLTRNQIPERRPSWSRDGGSVIFNSFEVDEDAWRFRLRRADASAEAGPFLEVDASVLDVRVSPDGRWIVYRVVATGENLSGLWIANREGGSEHRRLLSGDHPRLAPRFSPDGHWLAYLSNAFGGPELIVRPFPNVDAARIQISTAGANPPLWSPDGRALYYREINTGSMIEAEVEYEPVFRVVGRRVLFSTVGFMSNENHWQHDLSGDGQRFLMLRQGGDQGEGAVTRPGAHVLVENLLTEIEARESGR
jgi:serine/threonine-protein kinase